MVWIKKNYIISIQINKENVWITSEWSVSNESTLMEKLTIPIISSVKNPHIKKKWQYFGIQVPEKGSRSFTINDKREDLGVVINTNDSFQIGLRVFFYPMC